MDYERLTFDFDSLVCCLCYLVLIVCLTMDYPRFNSMDSRLNELPRLTEPA